MAESTAGLQELLGSLGPLETETIARILALARSAGCAGKMSGAGGGDGCVLFAPDAVTAKGLLDSLRARGIQAFELSIEGGLRGEPGSRGLERWLRE